MQTGYLVIITIIMLTLAMLAGWSIINMKLSGQANQDRLEDKPQRKRIRS